jgi:hypothetical protein
MDMRETTLPGRIANPKPMNPASTVYREPNPHVIHVITGAWTAINVAGDAEKWRKWNQEQRT